MKQFIFLILAVSNYGLKILDPSFMLTDVGFRSDSSSVIQVDLDGDQGVVQINNEREHKCDIV